MSRKEFGSDFHSIQQDQFCNLRHQNDFLNDLGSLYFSGRSALRAVLEQGIAQAGWVRLYLPSYYCCEVHDFVNDLDIEIIKYPYNPVNQRARPVIIDLPDSVLLVVNYFGVECMDYANFNQATIIEDITLNLDARSQSGAAICFGSLRKELPVPAGGFVNIKNGSITLPALNISPRAERLVEMKAKGMLMKSRYLQNEIDNKDLFRTILADAETEFTQRETHGALPLSAFEFLASLEYEHIKQLKQRNIRMMKQLLKPHPKFKILTSADDKEYACVLFFDDSADKTQLRDYLIAHTIYPMTLWPNQGWDEDRIVSEKILFIHIDFRHTAEDIQDIASKINVFFLTR